MRNEDLTFWILDLGTFFTPRRETNDISGDLITKVRKATVSFFCVASVAVEKQFLMDNT